MTPNSGIGKSLAGLVLASILPIVAFSGGVAWMFVERQEAAVAAQLAATTRALSVAVDHELDSELTAMGILATGHSLDQGDLSAFSDRARRVLAEHPAWLDVVLIDPRSHVIVESALPRPHPAPTSGAPAAVDQVVATGEPLIVGAFAQGEIVRQPMILLMTPVTRDDEVRYVMAVVLDPAVISGIFAGQRLPSSWTGTVFDGRMRIAGRSRNPRQFVGRLVTPQLAEHVAAADSGLFPSVNHEGQRLYAVFSRSALTGWAVAIGIPVAEYRRPIHRTVLVVAAAGLALVALALGLAILVGRHIVADRRASETAQKEAERLLATQATRYQFLLRTAVDGIHVLDEHGNLVEASDSFWRMLGYVPGEAPPLNVRDWDAVFPAETFDDRMAAHLAAPSIFETRHRRADGSVFDVEINCHGVEFEGRRYVYNSSRDITARKRLEAELRQSEERFRSLVEATTDWVWETDSEHRFSWVSPSLQLVTGVPPSEILGKRRWDLALPLRDVDAASWQGFMEDLGARRGFRDFRYWVRIADGQDKWISISGAPLFDDDGTFLGYRGSGSDITGESAAALRLKMLSTAVEQSPVSVLITDPDGTIEYVNSHFTIASGYQAVEAIGRNPRIMASGETPPETYRDLWATITAGRRWAGEMRNRRKDGELRWEEVIIAPVTADDGRVAHYVALTEDVTERRLLQDRLRQTNADLEQFAYIASHDLREPLRMVSSYLGLIARRLGPDLGGDIQEFLDFAVDGAKRMDRLILGLLDYSRTGRAGERVPVPLAQAVADARVNLTVAIREAGADIVVADGLPTVTGDPTDLTRLFQNLMGNAIKYQAPGRRPRVEVGWRRHGTEWQVSVTDNGIGIAPEDRERVFGIFQRLHAATEYEGTGIGLAICKKIVDRHGGRIWIEPVDGEGTTFTFTVAAV